MYCSFEKQYITSEGTVVYLFSSKREKGGTRLTLAINSLAHLLVDGVCAATLFGRIGADDNLWLLILLYNTLAFSTQCVTGLFTDKMRNHQALESVAIFLIFLGFTLPVPSLARVVFIGLGNSVFHVSAGAATLLEARGKAGPLGLFVAPGAVGLALGILWPAQLGGFLNTMMALCGVAIAALSARDGREAQAEAPVRPTAGPPPREGHVTLLVPVLLLLAVAVRAVGGAAVSFPWKTGAGLTLLTAACVAGGKALGGLACDRLGPGKTALLSLPLAAFLIAFCADSMPLSLLGQLLLNLTMPVTLLLLYRAMPDAPGLSFGLAASALWPGTIAGQLLTLTGPALWGCVLMCFLAGLAAILFAVKKIQKYENQINRMEETV
jgi:FSR family fosmidomycin resistance protein-like MFS transporter